MPDVTDNIRNIVILAMEYSNDQACFRFFFFKRDNQNTIIHRVLLLIRATHKKKEKKVTEEIFYVIKVYFTSL